MILDDEKSTNKGILSTDSADYMDYSHDFKSNAKYREAVFFEKLQSMQRREQERQNLRGFSMVGSPTLFDSGDRKA